MNTKAALCLVGIFLAGAVMIFDRVHYRLLTAHGTLPWTATCTVCTAIIAVLLLMGFYFIVTEDL